MTERSPEQQPGKFSSDRDEMLYLMASEAWFTDSDGSSDSPYGWFAYVENHPDELFEVKQAFEDVSPLFTGDLSQLVGAFVLVEDEQGFVTVHTFSSEDEARAAYEALSAAYVEWVEAGE